MKSYKLITIALFTSLLLNGYFYFQRTQWEEAFYRQVGTTAEVEMLFKQAAKDTSYENILSISKSIFLDRVKEVQADSIHIQYGLDDKAIKIIDATLLFKGGNYYGTKTQQPDH